MLNRIVNFLLILFIVNGLVITKPNRAAYYHARGYFANEMNETSQISGEMVLADPFDACTNLTMNATGKFVLARDNLSGQSPTCTDLTKVLNIQRSGAKAAIIMNYELDLWNGDSLRRLYFSEEEENLAQEVNIVAVYILKQTGDSLRQLFIENKTVEATLNTTGDIDYESPNMWMISILFSIMISTMWVLIGLLYAYQFIVKLCKGKERQRAVLKIPAKHYSKVKDIEKMDNTCAICLDDFNDTDMVKVLPCHHIFHSDCIDKWLIEDKPDCPTCRHPILPPQKKKELTPEQRRRRDQCYDMLIYGILIIFVVILFWPA
ncbi:hypothetical protein WA158_002168 [Blastocystis sp. Blastoise]